MLTTVPPHIAEERISTAAIVTPQPEAREPELTYPALGPGGQDIPISITLREVPDPCSKRVPTPSDPNCSVTISLPPIPQLLHTEQRILINTPHASSLEDFFLTHPTAKCNKELLLRLPEIRKQVLTGTYPFGCENFDELNALLDFERPGLAFERLRLDMNSLVVVQTIMERASDPWTRVAAFELLVNSLSARPDALEVLAELNPRAASDCKEALELWRSRNRHAPERPCVHAPVGL